MPKAVASPADHAAPYALARGCDTVLNSWCDNNCPHYSVHGPLLARFDRSQQGAQLLWRCYAHVTLSKDLSEYVAGSDYCTRHPQLTELLSVCENSRVMREESHVRSAAVDAAGGATLLTPSTPPRPSLAPKSARPALPPLNECCRAPLRTLESTPAPRYQHTSAFLRLPPVLRLPQLEDCEETLREGALFWAASLYTQSYAGKARRLVASCEAWGVCCQPALMPDGVLEGVEGENKEGSYALRHRLIATKPLFIYEVLRLSPLPLAWMDVDLEYHAFPTLFTPRGWAELPAPRDVLLWNWQANVSLFVGRRLKMASGVAWFNKTQPAEALLLAWAEAMAHEPNVRAPDDQVMDLLVNEDGWIDRVRFGWLPESYLRMMPRHKHIVPVIDHDRGAPVSGKGKNSPHMPVLPPHAA